MHLCQNLLLLSSFRSSYPILLPSPLSFSSSSSSSSSVSSCSPILSCSLHRSRPQFYCGQSRPFTTPFFLQPLPLASALCIVVGGPHLAPVTPLPRLDFYSRQPPVLSRAILPLLPSVFLSPFRTPNPRYENCSHFWERFRSFGVEHYIFVGSKKVDFF